MVKFFAIFSLLLISGEVSVNGNGTNDAQNTTASPNNQTRMNAVWDTIKHTTNVAKDKAVAFTSLPSDTYTKNLEPAMEENINRIPVEQRSLFISVLKDIVVEGLPWGNLAVPIFEKYTKIYPPTPLPADTTNDLLYMMMSKSHPTALKELEGIANHSDMVKRVLGAFLSSLKRIVEAYVNEFANTMKDANLDQVLKELESRNKPKEGNDAKLFKSQTLQRMASTKDTSFPSSTDTSSSIGPNQENDPVTLMLSSRQANLLLSSLWTQALSPENVPRNYEAISHTYSLMLLFSGAKGSVMEVLVGSFQLAFSLRSISLQAGFLPPSRRRSIFTLATSMLVFFAKAFNVPSLIPIVKHVLTESTVDPFLHLVEDCRLQALDRQAEPRSRVYGSKEDDDLALKSLSNVSMNEDQSKETSVSLILNSLENLSESELSTIRKQLLEEFSAEDVCPLGSHFTETPSISSAQTGKLHQKSLEVIPMGFVFEDDTLIEPDSLGEPQSQHTLDSTLLDVSQLLESVSDTSRHVGRLSVSTNHDLPFKELVSQCEVLTTGKQQKLSVCMSGHQKEDGQTSMTKLESSEQGSQIESFLCTTDEQGHTSFCKLPVLSPYDQFLTHAGC